MTWMQHNSHGGRADLPDLPYWRSQGWEPCDGPPPEPDLLTDPEAPAAEAPGLSAAQPAKPAAKAKRTEENDRG